MARVLIAGCGYVGGALGRRLMKRGDLVWGLRRRAGEVADGLGTVECDLTKPETLAELPANIDAVVFTAGSDASTPEAYVEIYLEGLLNLIEALQKQGQHPKRLLVASSTAVYAQREGEVVDEASPTEPTSFQGQILLESEQTALGSPFDTSVVRFGGIYGPGRTRMLDKLRRRAMRIGESPVFTNRIHRDDCAGVLEHLLDAEKPEPVVLAVDNEPVTRREVLDWIAERMGVEHAGIDPDAAPTGKNKRCNNARLLASGYQFTYPTFREGYGALIDES